jgi:hypothetical protein
VIRFCFAMLATCVLGCDVDITVGYNDAIVQGANCPADAPMRTCAKGNCVVAELAPAETGRETLAVDDDSIFFITDDDVISKKPKRGGDVAALVTAAPGLERIAIDEQNLYWTEYNGDIFRVSKNGGSATSVTKIFGNPVSIALHEEDIYVALITTGEIAKIEKNSGASQKLAGQGVPIDLTLDSTHVYWIDQGTAGGSTGSLVRAPLGDLTGAEVMRSNLEEPLILGVTPDAILWATYNKVFRLSRSGGDPQEFVAPFDEPKGVTEFDGIIYVAGQMGVHRIRVDDGDTLALDNRGVTGIALACDGLYGVGWFEPVLLRYGPK